MEEIHDKKIILFDGVCNLCNRSVNYVIKHDKKDVFRFAALQSEIGNKLVAQRNIDTTKIDSILLLEPNIAYYTKSTAALQIGKTFGGGWQLLTVLEWIPEVFRDWIYDVVARNRYQWFGKRDQCMIPTPELNSKFLA